MVKQNLSKIDPWLEPYADKLQHRAELADYVQQRIAGERDLAEFAQGYVYFGLHRTADGWLFREWAPNATKIYLTGDFCGWKDNERFRLQQLEHGQWEIKLPADFLKHKDLYKLHIWWEYGEGYRVPAWATRVVQDKNTHVFDAQVWNPEASYVWKHDEFTPTAPPRLIYEAHIGMSSAEEKVASYSEFTQDVLPRIKDGGYDTIQLMAIQEHPYYGSFGYHVSSYFAASSRFGTPEELKELVDTAHSLGIAVVLDLVHSHAVKNEAEGLSRFDGTYDQYFHAGERGNHEQWDSRVFDYGKPEVLHFLLSNCRYWLDEYHFDGYRFDGVTSMLYTHHGMGRLYTNYDDYFDYVDEDAMAYLTLANRLIHQLKPSAVTIAEEVSGMPGVAGKISDGGIGFDYRLNMGAPDNWIKLLKEQKDEDWNMTELYNSVTAHRLEEQTINYAESHDQALVGDKTIMFRLADKEMYDHMLVSDQNITIDRAIALHKMIRLLTAGAHNGGYLNFMGNEYGHPEWVDFPRSGNNWSYAYARRQWRLADNKKLKYRWLLEFDHAMISLIKDVKEKITHASLHDDDHVIAFVRGDYLFAYNFHPTKSFTDYGIKAPTGNYSVVLSSDAKTFGGQDHIDTALTYPCDKQIKLYLPARTAQVLKRKKD